VKLAKVMGVRLYGEILCPTEGSYVKPARKVTGFNISNAGTSSGISVGSRSAICSSVVTCIHVPVTVYRSGVQDFLCLV